MALTRDEILAMVDLSTKKVTVPASIPVWAGKEIYIKELSRGDQDIYLKRQFANAMLKRSNDSSESNMEMTDLYGHDAWICSKGACDADGKPLFSDSDIDELNKKSGQFVGWLAVQILSISGMRADVKAINKASQEIKNS
jgi:hypothetical protein